jgi:Icc-related predicted phosphoesterase
MCSSRTGRLTAFWIRLRLGGEHLGCEELLKAVEAVKPKVHIFGHIHGGAGIFENGTKRFVNAAYLNERYRPLEPAGKVRIIDL